MEDDFMGNLFKNNSSQNSFNANSNFQGGMSSAQMFANKYNQGRFNLLWVTLFTVINIIVLITNGGTKFLFSAAIPGFLIEFSMIVCGMYPDEFYKSNEPFEFVDVSLFYGAVAVSILICVFYLLCFLFSKKKVGWIIGALIIFSIDTVLMFLVSDVTAIIADIVFHAWVIASFSMAIYNHKKFKEASAMEMESAVSYDATAENVETVEENVSNTEE